MILNRKQVNNLNKNSKKHKIKNKLKKIIAQTFKQRLNPYKSVKKLKMN